MVFARPGKVHWSNNVQKDAKFNSDIDNLSSITDVKNFMIGAILREEDRKVMGVLQFMNKRDGTDITR